MSNNIDSLANSLIAEIKKSIEPGGKAYKEYRNVCDKVMLGSIKVNSGSNVHTPEEAAAKFIEVLRNSINSSGLSANAQNAISELDYTTPKKLGSGAYLITVYFQGDLSRPSLYPSKYPNGISDIAEALNDGINANGYVYGDWHGKRIRSKAVFPATQFMEQAVKDFMGNYGADYGVTECVINKEFS